MGLVEDAIKNTAQLTGVTGTDIMSNNTPLPDQGMAPPQELNPQSLSRAQAAIQNAISGSQQTGMYESAIKDPKNQETAKGLLDTFANRNNKAEPANKELVQGIETKFNDQDNLSGDPESILDRELSGESASTDSEPQAETIEDAEDDDLGVENKPIAENFKKLRELNKTTRKELKNKEQEIDSLKQNISKYESGEAVPEILQNMQEQLIELEGYREIVNLKASPMYRKKYVDVLNENGNKLKEFAKAYEVPEEILASSLDIKEDPKLSRFLSDHFDPTAALEVKQIVKTMQRTRTEALEAEKNAGSKLTELQVENQVMMEQEDANRRERIGSNSKAAYSRALKAIKDEGIAKELILQPGNSEFNSRFVIPIQQAAAKNYGRMVKDLVDNGLKELPDHIAQVLAETVLRATASDLAIESRDATEREWVAFEKDISTVQRLLRPSIGGNSHGNSIRPSLNEGKQTSAQRLLQTSTK